MGIELILVLQNLGEWLLGPMQFFTFLGKQEFYMLLLPALYWCVDSALGFRVGIYLLSCAGVNNLLKLVFHQPRPYWVYTQVKAFASESSFGIPSGHAQNGVVLWSLIAQAIQRRWAWLVAFFLIFIIGTSRLYLGVHFPQDVFGGWGIGLILLLLFFTLEKPVISWFSRVSLAVGLLAILVITLVLVSSTAIVYNGMRAWPLPSEWVENALRAFPGSEPINPLDTDEIVAIGATLFGMSTGKLLISRGRDFDTGGHWIRRVLRFIFGFIGIILILEGPALYLTDLSPLTVFSLRMVQYALVGFWITFLAPIFFQLFRLADARKPGHDPGYL